MVATVPASLQFPIHYKSSVQAVICTVDGCKHVVDAEYLRRHGVAVTGKSYGKCILQHQVQRSQQWYPALLREIHCANPNS